MTDNNQDRSQGEGQEGIDRETELRNRENETGQSQGQQFGQQPPAADATLSERTGQTEAEAPSDDAAPDSFVGTGKDETTDALTKGEQNPDFAPEGQGAQDTDAGRSDIETGQAQDRASGFDDGSDSDH